MFNRREDYRAAWERAYLIDPPIPLNVDIELASVCNLACPFCFYGEADWNAEMQKPAADGKPKKRFMPASMAYRIIEQAAALNVPALKFNWRGESTMHPEYSNILEAAAAMKHVEAVKVASNGNGKPAFFDLLVNTNANCKDSAIPGLMRATKVMVSLDSTIPSIYKKMRVNGDLNRAIYVIRELVRRGHSNVWVRRVMTKENQQEPFAHNVRVLFGKSVHISEHACFDRNADEHHQLNDPKFDRTYCGYPSQRMMIASDGTVFPCCVDYDGTMEMGRFPEKDLLSIWNGAPFKKLRMELRDNFFRSKACSKCTSWMAYNAPEREQVQDREIKA